MPDNRQNVGVSAKLIGGIGETDTCLASFFTRMLNHCRIRLPNVRRTHVLSDANASHIADSYHYSLSAAYNSVENNSKREEDR